MATKARENHREDVAGRANVEDTPELLATMTSSKSRRRARSGRSRTRSSPGRPSRPPFRLVELRGHARACVALRRSGRRPKRPAAASSRWTIPAGKGTPPRVGWLYSGLQVMQPGEFATAHAHSASALRFVMEGKGAYTVVDGHKMTLGAGDFVLTPNGTWHDHGVDPATARRRSGRTASTCCWSTARRQFLCGASRSRQKSTIRSTTRRTIYGGPGLLPAGGEAGASRIRRCSNTSGAAPTRRCSARATRPTARPMTAS